MMRKRDGGEREMSSPSASERRYSELGVSEALRRQYDYPKACEELSLILRKAYSKLPKPLQSRIFQDTLFAFRRLPEVQTSQGMSSANVLVQAVEVSLPKQKKSVAVSEFKNAMVAHKRRGKTHQDEGTMQVPQDVLVHIFRFLDVQALVVVSSVCWAWNSASCDNTLWRSKYSLLFGDYDIKTEGHTVEGKDAITSLDWKVAFKRKYTGTLTWRLTSHRAKCEHCKSLLWTSHITCGRAHNCPEMKDQKLKVKSVLPYKIVEYLLGDTDLTSSSDSDSDSDGSSLVEQQLRRLWAYPRLISTRNLAI
ncbi:F-box protein isoform X1 [Iris pallida]|uniref:F-box protein isoform X1 n=1 Tax=Iris pallida TaxID=29817 RepID=A0AAX6HN49_IRIPA|nr:F-box protein isoform X1 [Iris pallida]